MNVIFAVDPIFPPLTGIGRYTLELARRLPLQQEVTQIRFYSHGSWVEDPELLLDITESGASFRRSLAQSRLAVRLYGYIQPLIGKVRLGAYRNFIYHSPNFFLPPFPGFSVATFHDLSMYRHPEFHPPARVEFLHREIPKALKRAHHLIADSAFIAEEISAYLGFPRASMSVVPCGVSAGYHPRSADETRTLLARYGLFPDSYTLCVSTIEPRKNIANLLVAYGGLEPEVRNRYPLVLCGDRGWRSEGTHDAIEQAQRAGWLKYLGYVPEQDLPVIYSGARAFAYVPYYEGFGLPVLEAMASGVPVIASNKSALPELCEACARLVEPDDIDGIRDAIDGVLQDESWRATAIGEGLLRAAKYTWDATAARLANTYRKFSQI